VGSATNFFVQRSGKEESWTWLTAAAGEQGSHQCIRACVLAVPVIAACIADGKGPGP